MIQISQTLLDKFIYKISELENGTAYGQVSLTCFMKGKGKFRFVIEQGESYAETEGGSVSAGIDIKEGIEIASPQRIKVRKKI